MMRPTLFTILLMAGCSVSLAGTVYKWVDDNGVVHYSDQPHENAQKVELKAPQTYTPTKAPATGPAYRNEATSKQAPVYQTCMVTEPTDDQVYMNTSTVTAGVIVQPTIRPGDTTVVTLDGQQVPGVPATGGQFTISPVDRGTHSIQVTVKDPTGVSVCSSPAVTFHVHQPSLLNPVQPVKPR